MRKNSNCFNTKKTVQGKTEILQISTCMYLKMYSFNVGMNDRAPVL